MASSSSTRQTRYGTKPDPGYRRLALAPGLIAAIALLIGATVIADGPFVVVRYIVSIFALIVARVRVPGEAVVVVADLRGDRRRVEPGVDHPDPRTVVAGRPVHRRDRLSRRRMAHQSADPRRAAPPALRVSFEPSNVAVRTAACG